MSDVPLTSRHGKYILDLGACRILESPLDAQEETVVGEADTPEDLLRLLEKSTMGFQGERRSIRHRLKSVIWWNSSAATLPSEAMAQALELRRVDPHLYLREVDPEADEIDGPISVFYQKDSEVWSVHYQGRRVDTLYTFVQAAYRANQLAETLRAKSNSDG